jgi:hypothetical protein
MKGGPIIYTVAIADPVERDTNPVRTRGGYLAGRQQGQNNDAKDDFEVFEGGMKQSTKLHGDQGRWLLRNSEVTPR